MGSLEEDELVRMVQDFIESEPTSSPTSSASSNSQPLHHRTQYFILQDILRSSEGNKVAEAKVLKSVLKQMKGNQCAEKTTSNLNKWLVPRLKMDGFNASICQTSLATSFGCPAGEYEYIEVITEEEKYCNPMRLIVDIDFRSQFELAKPTQYYRELTDSLPVIFIGSEEKLCKIISLVCSAAKQCLREKGLHVPPWRTTGYMQSKWLSRCCSKEPNHAENGRENYKKAKVEIIGNFALPNPNPNPIIKLKPKKRELGEGSGLSIQLSNMSINCC